MFKCFFLALAVSLSSIGRAAQPAPTAEASVALSFTPVFVGGSEGYACYRIPAMVTTAKGTILAMADGRISGCGDIPNPLDLVLKRSYDQGRTWMPLQVVADYGKNPDDTDIYPAYGLTNPVSRVAAGDAALLLDRTNGRVWVLYDNGAYVPGRPHNRALKLELRFSDDDGVTWSAGIDIESQNPGLRPAGADFLASPGNGIQLDGGIHAGRLIFAAYVWAKPFYSTIIFSDDHGRSWRRGGNAGAGGGEIQVAETLDGNLLATIRNNTFTKQGVRFFNTSPDGGETWGTPYFETANQPSLPDPKCQASLLRVPPAEGSKGGRLVLANAADATSRTNLTLKLSDDEGRTWPTSHLLYDGSAAYSALTMVSPGELGILVEMDKYKRIGFVHRSIAALAGQHSPSANWPHWRGPQDTGSTEGGSYPVKWDAEKVLWKAPLTGKGCSTPIVWNQRIYLTAPVNAQDAALAFDWAGRPLWQTTFGQEKAGRHRNGSGCNASPATDGHGVFVYFKSGVFAALGFDGKVRWQTNLVERFGPDTLYWDHGTSPVLTENYVIMARMHQGESWLAAFDKATGELRWKVPRNYETVIEGDHGYSTPLLIDYHGKQALLVWGGEHVTLQDSADGKLLWTCGDFHQDAKPNWPTVASMVVADDVAIVPFGRADHSLPRLHGIKVGASFPTQPVSGGAGSRLWKRDDAGTFVPTPVVYKSRIYIVRDRGEVECLEPVTGKTLWSAAFPKASANFYASPVIAGGNLYAVREDGVVFVARVDGGFELLAENKMSERVIASPVPVSNRLFIRGEQHLFCVEK